MHLLNALSQWFEQVLADFLQSSIKFTIKGKAKAKEKKNEEEKEKERRKTLFHRLWKIAKRSSEIYENC